MNTFTRTIILIATVTLLLFLTSIPSSASISLVGGLAHSKTAKPGESYKGTLIIRNTGSQTTEVRVYQTDYLFYSDGSNIYGKPGELPHSNAKWIEYNPDRVMVPASGTAEINYVVTVPGDENLAGTYWSMMMVEEVNSPGNFSGLKKDQVGISQVLRYGVQMITTIGTTGKSDLKFFNLKLIKSKEGKRNLSIDIENTGEKLLTINVWVEIYSTEGRYIGKFEDARMRLLPGTSARRQVDLGDVPAGEYKAMIVADAGGDRIFGINYTLIFK